MRARKRFGQHFLVDPGVLGAIERAVRPQSDDLLLEIGPGQGALTEWIFRSADPLASRGGRYVAIEIDRDLVPMLKARFPGIEIINADVLRVDLAALLGDGQWRIVGNLPYNISTPLLVLLLAHLAQVRDMHFMLQREVARRLAASPGTRDWGRLTVLVQYHCVVEELFDVGPESFSPPPRVWSAVVRLTPRREKPVIDMGALDTVLRHAFSQRRKRLSNALQSLSLDWAATGVDPGKRADAVSLEEYLALTRALLPEAT